MRQTKQATTTTTTPAPCFAATSGEGYWTCDTLGGCPDCRALARAIDDADTLEGWRADLAGVAR